MSVPGACYFVTWATGERRAYFDNPASILSARGGLLAALLPDDGTILAATIMPDHIHVLLELGDRLNLSQVINKLKNGVSRDSGISCMWQ